MTDNKFEFADATKMEERQALALEFYEQIMDDDEKPMFVSDEATLYDIYAGDESVVKERCWRHYGVELEDAHFTWKFWQLLEFLDANCVRLKN